MTKLVVMYPWPKDPEHFRRHYLSRHLPLCRAIPGILASQYTFEPRVIQGSGRWFCIFEAEFADESALQAALATPQAKQATEDVANYSPERPTLLVYELQPV